jgi:hypothetical protein|tara:strand:- start:18165 stop:18680 length:516 start_codon:yes stop_codon:yes gene_type:complete
MIPSEKGGFMNSILSKILAGIALIFVVVQFFGPDQTLPDADPAKDFLANTNPPQEVTTIIKTACYDCHSYQTKYPWYAGIEPLSWWLQDHIEHGRDELNFSEWTDYTTRRADHKLEEAIELVEEEEMPLPSYTRVHWEANLTDQQREELNKWFTSVREQLPSEPEDQTEED